MKNHAGSLAVEPIHETYASYRLCDFSNLISSLHATLCDMDLINLGKTSSLICADCAMTIAGHDVRLCARMKNVITFLNFY